MALEGELTPILVQMVKSANMNGLLDNDIESLSGCQQRVKARLHEIMQKDQTFTEEDFDRVNRSVKLLLNCKQYFCRLLDLYMKRTSVPNLSLVSSAGSNKQQFPCELYEVCRESSEYM